VGRRSQNVTQITLNGIVKLLTLLPDP